MHPEVRKLLKLQDIDNRLEILRQELETRPRLLESQDGQLSAVERKRTDTSASILAKKLEIDRAGLDLKTFEERIIEVKKKITAVKTNAEYTAILDQIKGIEDERDRVEERLLGLWEEIEALQAAEKEIEKEFEEAKEVLAEEHAVIDQDLDEIKAEANQLLAQRAEARSPVQREELETYDRLFSRYRDRSVVSAESAVCSGCHISLSPQTINLLQSDREVVCCKNCSRILYL